MKRIKNDDTLGIRIGIVLIAMVLFCGVLYLGSCLLRPQPVVNTGADAVSETEGKGESASKEQMLPDQTEVQAVSWDIHQGNLILVNNQTKFVEQVGQEKQNITEYPDHAYQSAREGMQLDVNTLKAVNQMVADYKKETGDTGVTIISGYRSIEAQEEILADEIADVGEEEAKRWVTEPGYSEHHTGYAVDFSIYYYDKDEGMRFVDSPAAEWFLEKGPSYGLIKRYEEDKESITQIANEPWHFRYLGVAHATAIVQTEYCYEEYIDYLKQFTYDGEHLKISAGGADYEIYYASGSEIKVPAGSEYTISGNNVDGLIATVMKK